MQILSIFFFFFLNAYILIYRERMQILKNKKIWLILINKCNRLTTLLSAAFAILSLGCTAFSLFYNCIIISCFHFCQREKINKQIDLLSFFYYKFYISKKFIRYNQYIKKERMWQKSYKNKCYKKKR